ncbi:MAG: hypothetical protein EZS28_021787 [Streblomastix strix]|uniref:Uncharacterized protein n=1 Tax=Streblomastix strix TaxID=222440 RepID=A0A5J4VJL3_9EUKA|nr:MAG: hypothetical protein EZS28_021787 [Streblomastix strix]
MLDQESLLPLRGISKQISEEHAKWQKIMQLLNECENETQVEDQVQEIINNQVDDISDKVALQSKPKNPRILEKEKIIKKKEAFMIIENLSHTHIRTHLMICDNHQCRWRREKHAKDFDEKQEQNPVWLNSVLQPILMRCTLCGKSHCPDCSADHIEAHKNSIISLEYNSFTFALILPCDICRQEEALFMCGDCSYNKIIPIINRKDSNGQIIDTPVGIEPQDEFYSSINEQNALLTRNKFFRRIIHAYGAKSTQCIKPIEIPKLSPNAPIKQAQENSEAYISMKELEIPQSRPILLCVDCEKALHNQNDPHAIHLTELLPRVAVCST